MKSMTLPEIAERLVRSLLKRLFLGDNGRVSRPKAAERVFVGESGSVEPKFDGDVTLDGTIYWTRVPPKKSLIQRWFTAWLEARQEYGHSLWYPFWAIAHFGFWEAVSRTWKFCLHPKHAIYWVRDKIRRFQLVDRRKKSYEKTVYAVDRDGDLYLVECPRCHQTQHLVFNRVVEGVLSTNCVPARTFQCCFPCDIGFRVWTEDGVRTIKDHRDGVPPLPSVVVWDHDTIRLGIAADAPWWWRRREISRDLQPNGKDAHGHKLYEIFPTTPTDNMGSQLMGSQLPDAESK